MKASIVVAFALAAGSAGVAHGTEPVRAIQEAGITGGLVARVGSADVTMQSLGQRFHIRLLLDDAATADKAQAAIDGTGLTGRFTVSVWDGVTLPFADRVLNALVLAKPSQVGAAEARRVLAPRGLLVTPAGVERKPVPKTIDDWTHYLYDASGNAVSKDQEVASPVSFRWGAAPCHLRSHNHGSSFTGLVTGGGRMFHFLDEGTFLFDKGGPAALRGAPVPRRDEVHQPAQARAVALRSVQGCLAIRTDPMRYLLPVFEAVTVGAHKGTQTVTNFCPHRKSIVRGTFLQVALAALIGSSGMALPALAAEVLVEAENPSPRCAYIKESR
jgi:hypothetical protein